MRILHYIIFIFVIPLLSLYSQENIKFLHKRFGYDPSRNSINKIIQDKHGYLWFATKSGLIRDDGYHPDIFTYDYKDTTSLPGNFIRDISETEDDKIWLATDEGGFAIYDQRNGRFKRLNLQKKFPKVKNIDRAWTLHQDMQDSDIFWLGTMGGLIKYNVVTNVAQIFTTENSLISDNSIIRIFEDSSNRLWIGTMYGGLNLFNKKDSFIAFRKEKGEYDSIGSDNVFYLYEDKNHTIWAGLHVAGLARIDMADTSVTVYYSKQFGGNLSHYHVLGIIETEKFPGKLVLAEWTGGIDIFDPLTGEIRNISKNAGFESNDILSVFEDNSGILWFGTEVGGLQYILPTASEFVSHSLNFGKRPPKVMDIIKYKNEAWIATTNGLFIYQVDNRNLYRFDDIYPDVQLSDENFQFLRETENGTILIGTFFNGINVFDPQREDVRYFGQKELSGSHCRNVYISPAGEYWVSTYIGGIYIYDSDFQLKETLNSGNGKLKSDNTSGLIPDKNGYLWIGSSLHGIAKINISTGETEYVLDQKSLSSGVIYNLQFDKKERLVISTIGGGINIFDPAKKTVEVYNQKKGLPGDNIGDVVEDSQGNLWVCTTNGLSKYDDSKKDFFNYGFTEGLEQINLISASYFKDEDLIMIGTNEGFFHFSPSLLGYNTYIPPVHIKSAKILRDNISYGSELMFLEELELDYNQDIVSFEFTALNYIFPGKNQFSYKIEGISDDWIDLGFNRSINVTNLSPGSYNLRVKASNNDGFWNNEGASLKIYVKSPFWQTWWFNAILVSVLLFLMYSISRYRENKKKAVQNLRMKIASDLHDDIGSSLTKISINAGMLRYEREMESMKSRVDKIENASKEVISSMSDIIWSIDSRRDKLSELITRMKNIAFDVLNEKDIEIDFKADIPSKDIILPVIIKENVFLIFKEAINNIARHSGASEVEVDFIIGGKNMELIIQDNGMGLPEKRNSRGNGIGNMEARAEKIESEIKFINNGGLKITLKSKNFLISHK